VFLLLKKYSFGLWQKKREALGLPSHNLWPLIGQRFIQDLCPGKTAQESMHMRRMHIRVMDISLRTFFISALLSKTMDVS
jgi:hypothetical protein